MGSTFAAGGKDTLIIGKQDDTVSLDPTITYESSAWGILGQVYEKLVNFEGDKKKMTIGSNIDPFADSEVLLDRIKSIRYHIII